MEAPGDRAVISRGLRTALASANRSVVAAGLLVSLIALIPLLYLPEIPVLIAIGVVLWAIWSLIGGAVARSVGRDLGGRPLSRREALRFALARWPALFGTPIVPLLYCAGMLALAFGLAQVVRIPFAGWPLLVLLSPAILVLAFLAGRLLLRFLFVEHLALPAVALDESRTFHAFARLFAWFRARPARITGLHSGALTRAVIWSTLRAIPWVAVAGLVWWLLPEGPSEAVSEALRGPFHAPSAGTLGILFLVAVPLSWIASPFVATIYGAHAALYLVQRRAIDGVPIDAPPIVSEGDKSLSELGIELVQRLRDGVEED